MKLTSAFLVVCGVLSAQTVQDENSVRAAAGLEPIFRVTVTERTAKAINYQHRSGATKIDFTGTDLLPAARGEAKVEGKQGYIEIEVEYDNLQPATKFGSEYLTYVLWAVTPEGRTSNLGEILLNGTRSKLDVTTELQVFALLVTAEPYFSVTRPSDFIVMTNKVRPDTRGIAEEIDAKYELLVRGQYQRLSNPLSLKLDKRMPLELYEARNAVQIARSMGADRFATDTFVKAEKSLADAEAYQARNAGKKPVTMMARQSVQTAEDARAIAVKRQEENVIAADKQQSADRESRALVGQAAAESETDRVKRAAESARVSAQNETDRLVQERAAQAAASLAEADRVKRDNDARIAAIAATNAADTERVRQENEARTAATAAATAAEVDRLKLENAAIALAAKTESDRLKSESDSVIAAASAEAARLKLANDAQNLAAQNDLARAEQQKNRLESERASLRVLLLQQFNAVLQTRDSARGLIVNMSDVLFDTGKSTLRPAAREKLAKVAGIVAGHPGLRLAVEGHTDSVGSDESNQVLSEHRGSAVYDYLTHEGIAASAITSKGLGETQPVASNVTAAGRQQNRRVELVVSGDVIGTEIGAPVAVR